MRRTLAVALLAPALFATAAHVLEAPGKWRIPPGAWLAVQQGFYGPHAVRTVAAQPSAASTSAARSPGQA